MTHEVLRADIDLAMRLRDEQRPADEIITALVHRGVSPSQAVQLLDTLSKGEKPISKSPMPTEMTLTRRSRSRSVSREDDPVSPARHSRPKVRSGSASRSTSHARSVTSLVWLAIAGFAVLVIVVGGIVLIQRHSARTDAGEESQPKIPKVGESRSALPAKAVVPSQKPPLASLALELQPDGLHLGASVLTSGNVLTAVAKSLGIATRTNQVGLTDTVVYAYDRAGLLVYTQKGGGTNRIILDCEAGGGNQRTSSPFAGTLTVEGQVIRPDTDSQTLGAIKPLGLSRSGNQGDVWTGRYHGLDLVFTCSRASQRLSLIEIGLK